jgi:CBS-domain-containing membrane protein
MLPERNLRFYQKSTSSRGSFEESAMQATQVTVQEVMTGSPIAVRQEATIDEVLQTLITEGVQSVYVTTPENQLAGVVTDYEVLKHQVLGGDRQQTAASLMSRTVPTVGPKECAMAVCPQFRDARLARMAVIDADGRLIGNLSRADVMRMMLTLERMQCEKAEPCVKPESTRAATNGEISRVVPAPRGARAVGLSRLAQPAS